MRLWSGVWKLRFRAEEALSPLCREVEYDEEVEKIILESQYRLGILMAKKLEYQHIYVPTKYSLELSSCIGQRDRSKGYPIRSPAVLRFEIVLISLDLIFFAPISDCSCRPRTCRNDADHVT